MGMKIGVFDSGKGGYAMADRLQELLPSAEIICVDDHTHVPYGRRTDADIISLSDAALQPLLSDHCDAIVIACNTATTVALTTLRERYPSQVFIGIEPMLKPAVGLTKTGTIAVLATHATLNSARYLSLKETFATNVTVIEPDCHDWAELIERDTIDHIPLETTIASLVDADVDVIVLACTHYHLLKDGIAALVPERLTILEPSDAIAERISSLLNRLSAAA